MKDLSNLLGTIPASVTLAINDRARAFKAAGQDVVSLAGGDPDFVTPPHIVEAAIAAIQAGKTRYPAPTKGLPETMAAIADKMARENNIYVDPKTDIIVTPGSKWSLFLALSALTNPGDEILYLEPVWVSYPAMIRLTGGTPVPVSLPAATDYTITAELLRAKITPRTKALMVNSPCNPTGRMLTRSEVEAIVQVATEADLYVITDEVYEKLAYDDRPHYSLAAEPGMAGPTLTTNGLSKAYAMTGWRLGWLAGPTEIMKLASRMHSQSVTSAATFTMSATVVALDGPQDAVEEMRQIYQERRDFMVKALNEIEGIHCPVIDGAFYLLPAFTNTEKDSLELAELLLDEAQVAATPGIAFGASAEKHLRFSICTPISELEKAAERLARVVPGL